MSVIPAQAGQPSNAFARPMRVLPRRLRLLVLIGFRVVWGVSDNTRRWISLDEARALGYEPQDDSEVFAAQKIAAEGEPDPHRPPHDQVGGYWRLPEADPEGRTPRIDRKG
jgi:uronate dehydrogenase